jgi:hypothetical protein
MTTLTVGNYKLLITLNAADIIVRAEHQTNKRLYESTFTADDFPGCDVYGGLEAVGRILLSAFKGADGASCRLDHERGDALDYCVNVGGLVPIKYTLRLFPKRREPKTQVAEDVEELRAECATLKAEVKALQTVAAAAATATPAAIILPGCPVPIPTSSVQLVLTDKIMGDVPVSICPGKHCDIEHIKNAAYWSYQHNQYACTCKNPAGGQHMNIPTKEFMRLWSLQPYDFTTHRYVCTGTDISELKHMKHLSSLIITNPFLQNGSVIKDMKRLRTLELHCPQLQDISWLTELTNLQELNLEGCTAIKDVSMCKSLTNLIKLNIKGTGVRNTEMLTSSRLAIEK